MIPGTFRDLRSHMYRRPIQPTKNQHTYDSLEEENAWILDPTVRYGRNATVSGGCRKARNIRANSATYQGCEIKVIVHSPVLEYKGVSALAAYADSVIYREIS